MGIELLPAADRFSELGSLEPEISSCSSSSFSSYSSWMSGVNPTPAVALLLVQLSHVCCCTSPRTRLANAPASSGDRQVPQSMPLLQSLGAIVEESLAVRPLSRLYPALVTSLTTLMGGCPRPPALLPPIHGMPVLPLSDSA